MATIKVSSLLDTAGFVIAVGKLAGPLVALGLIVTGGLTIRGIRNLKGRF